MNQKYNNIQGVLTKTMVRIFYEKNGTPVQPNLFFFKIEDCNGYNFYIKKLYKLNIKKTRER